MLVSEVIRRHTRAALSVALLFVVLAISGGFKERRVSINRYNRPAYRQSLLSDTEETDWMVKQAFQTFVGNTQQPVQDFLKRSENKTAEEKSKLCLFLGDMTDLMAEISSEHTMEMLRSMPELERREAFAAMMAAEGNSSAAAEGGDNATDAAPANASKVALLAKFNCPTDGAGEGEEDEDLEEEEEEEEEEEDDGAQDGASVQESDHSGGGGVNNVQALRTTGLVWPGQVGARGSLFVKPRATAAKLAGGGAKEVKSPGSVQAGGAGQGAVAAAAEPGKLRGSAEHSQEVSKLQARVQAIEKTLAVVLKGPGVASVAQAHGGAVQHAKPQAESERRNTALNPKAGLESKAKVKGAGAGNRKTVERERGAGGLAGEVGTVWEEGEVMKLEREAEGMGLVMEKAEGKEAAERRARERERERKEEVEKLDEVARELGLTLQPAAGSRGQGAP